MGGVGGGGEKEKEMGLVQMGFVKSFAGFFMPIFLPWTY